MQYRVQISLFILALSFILSACGEKQAPTNHPLNTSNIVLVEGSPEAIGLLAFLNHVSTTYEVLDLRVPLNSRAAEHIISHRNGKDGDFASSDDNPITSIAELDSIELVGPITIQKLRTFAMNNGWYPVNNDVLGIFDEVTVTHHIGDMILDLVNNGSRETLDVEVGLNSIAVDSIVLARPIQSMDELAAIYFVGTEALELLKAFVTPKPNQCLGYNDCSTELSCVGMSYDGYGLPGICLDTKPQIGEGASCSLEESCDGNLVCVGLHSTNKGWCAPQWHVGLFNQSNAMALTFANSDTSESNIHISGLAPEVAEIEVHIDMTHEEPQQVGILLRSPQGAIFEIGKELETTVFTHIVTPLPEDLEANGVWTLLVSSQSRVEVATLNSWSLRISSRW